MARRIKVRPGDVIVQRGTMPAWLFWTLLVGALLTGIATASPWLIPIAIFVGIAISPLSKEVKTFLLVVLGIGALMSFFG